MERTVIYYGSHTIPIYGLKRDHIFNYISLVNNFYEIDLLRYIHEVVAGGVGIDVASKATGGVYVTLSTTTNSETDVEWTNFCGRIRLHVFPGCKISGGRDHT